MRHSTLHHPLATSQGIPVIKTWPCVALSEVFHVEKIREIV